MKYCYSCHLTTPGDLLFCPECRVELVEIDIPKSSGATSPDDSWVIVGGVKDNKKIESAKGGLDFNNIPSVFLPAFDNHGLEVFIDTPFSEKSDQPKIIMVPREFKDEAMLVLREIVGDALEKFENYGNWR